MPYAGQHIDTPKATFWRIAPEAITTGDRTVVVKDNHVSGTFENEKGLCFWRIGVTMWPYIGPMEQDIEKAMWIVAGA